MKKKHLATLFLLTMVAVLLGAVFFYVAHLYNGTGLALIAEHDKAYEYNGKLLLSEDRTEALRLIPLGKTDFETIPLTTLDLSPFGFAGASFSYFRVDYTTDIGVKETYLYTPQSEYEGFWPVLKPERLVYKAEDGNNYCIHPTNQICYPMFSGSIEGVDPYGKDVVAFSANGSYAIGMTGSEITVYHTDPRDDTLRVVDVKNVSLKEYKNVSFGAFAGNTTAYFVTDEGYLALDCTNGTVAKSLLDQEGTYSEPVCRVFAQRLDTEKDEHRAVWSHLLLGEERKTPKLKDFSSFEVFAVSPAGNYAAIRAEGTTEEILVSTEKRAFSLTALLEDGMKVKGLDFIHENLIYVSLENSEGKVLSRCYKVCF